MPNLRILIADDHPLIRRGVRDLLDARKDWEIVAEAHDGIEVVKKAGELRPDVAILDFSMPLLEGPAAAAEIQRISPATKVIILTMHDSDEVIREVLRSGARGYVLKTDADQELISAVETVTQLRHFFPPRVSETVLKRFLGEERYGRRRSCANNELTPREREVLALLAEGVTSKQIAGRLEISVRTVESHRIHINRKLGFGSIAELVRYAIRHRLTPAT